ncbi:MAG: YkgJ family cysteine cluster protein [Thermodesulfovibrionales bacterium]
MIEPDGKPHECERCGECCAHGGPFLFSSDLQLFVDGTLRPGDVYTLRKGELEYDIVHEEVAELPQEMIRIKELPGAKACGFYDPDVQGCTIYERRPLQCVHYECWYPKRLFKIMSEERLSRHALFSKMPALLELIDEHEEMCSFEKIERIVEQIQSGSEEAANELLELLRYDSAVREAVAEKLNIRLEDVDVMFGRPLTLAMKMYGYNVIREEDGAFCLVLRESS